MRPHSKDSIHLDAFRGIHLDMWKLNTYFSLFKIMLGFVVLTLMLHLVKQSGWPMKTYVSW